MTEATTRSIPPEAFRACAGEFATGVTVVIAEHEQEAAGMTLNAFASVSLEPAVVLVSLAHGSRTHVMVSASGRFAVSVLGRDQRGAALDFAAPGAPFPHQHVARTFDDFLIVAGATASHHCVVKETIRHGDHDVVIGSVVGITHAGGEPLIFHRGRFGGISADAAVPSGYPIALDEGGGW